MVKVMPVFDARVSPVYASTGSHSDGLEHQDAPA